MTARGSGGRTPLVARPGPLSPSRLRTAPRLAILPAVHDRLRTATVALLVGTALLCGCSERQQASTTLPSATAPATSSPALPPLGPAEFPVPPEARTKDAAGAEAFLRYWIDLGNRLQVELDGQPLRDLGPNCDDCQRIARAFDQVRTAGNKYEGGEITLNDVTEPQIGDDTASITFNARQESVRVVAQDGSVVDPGIELQPNLGSGITLTWSDQQSSWLVEAVTIG